jgi:PKHD-type hydroxylase
MEAVQTVNGKSFECATSWPNRGKSLSTKYCATAFTHSKKTLNQDAKMMTCIHNLLSPQEVFQLRQAANAMPFVPGTETAGQRASRIKHNEQISQSTNDRKALQHLLLTALMRNKEFNRAALPKHIRPPMICRYQPGMSYGLHVDSGLMGPKLGRQRSDISVTVFLNDITDYDGGILRIQSAFGPQDIKLPSGSAVIYPSTSLHEVTEVMRGERLVAVTWVESYVREEQQREILLNLLHIKDKLNSVAVDAAETDLAHHTYSNLLRMWAQT